MKKTLLKFLPIIAAVLFATSCGKDDEASVDTNNNVTEQDTDEIVTIPFSIRTNTGRSLTKVQTPEEFTPFSQNDVDQKSMSVKCNASGYSDVTGSLMLKNDGSYYFEGSISCSKSHQNALLNGDITLVGTYGTALTKVVSSKESLNNLRNNCNHLYITADFTFSSDKITLIDQNAYLEIKMSPLQHEIVVNGVTCKLDGYGYGWVAVPSNTVVDMNFVTKSAADVKPGEIYQVDRRNLVDLGISDGTLWADRNVGANDYDGFGYYFNYDGRNMDQGGVRRDDLMSAPLSIPTGGTDDDNDFSRLYNQCYWQLLPDETDNTKIKGYYVFKSKDKTNDKQLQHGSTETTYNPDSDPHIFLPASGEYYNTHLGYISERGCYWSNNKYTTQWGFDVGYYLNFDKDGVEIQNNYTSDGKSLRAVRHKE